LRLSTFIIGNDDDDDNADEQHRLILTRQEIYNQKDSLVKRSIVYYVPHGSCTKVQNNHNKNIYQKH